MQVWAWASFWEEEVDFCSLTVLFLEVDENISLEVVEDEKLLVHLEVVLLDGANMQNKENVR